ncbi:hypothetical protein BDP27DRAFT_1312791 [Rhodocollybia butyracea]|uniref:T6SS Phospholipase effector Tle1-like catalytic domain-containing protein n=1 Tax=Rhodocollybia butyracea TaxID=206335 RepID=A0A9P5Q7Z7_9AGAR|nr:hypothetical protein BDP27DRAFT_1312791 [Rhodocollybia butyracea]
MNSANGMNTTNPHHKRDTTMTSLTDTVLGENTEQMDGEPLRKGSKFTVQSPASEAPTNSPTHAHSRPLRDRKVDSDVIPPHENIDHRTLILCFDGTGDQFDADNSNIVQFCTCLYKEDHTKQMVYYQTGIGTYTSPAVDSPVKSQVLKLMNKLIAKDLSAHVMDRPGDRICLFGFSRGAFTARSLAGMLHKVGLLPAGNFQQVPFAYRVYLRKEKDEPEASSKRFKEAFCRDVKIQFLGVWDTVDSVGLVDKLLPFSASNSSVHTFRHALSLDEHRAKFQPNFWSLPHCPKEFLGDPANRSDDTEKSDRKGHAPVPSASSKQRHSLLRPSSGEWDSEEDNTLRGDEKRLSVRTEDDAAPTDVKEVWFAVNVGGGSVANSTRHSLARISLRWMIRECFKTESGIMFHSHRLKQQGLDIASLHPLTPRPPPLSGRGEIIQTIPRKGWLRILPIIPKRFIPRDKEPVTNVRCVTEEDEELYDSLCPKYDQLRLAPAWWIIELFPLIFRYQDKHDHRTRVVRCNCARPRHLPERKFKGALVHRSVQIRMDAEKKAKGPDGKPRKYHPKITLPPGER